MDLGVKMDISGGSEGPNPVSRDRKPKLGIVEKIDFSTDFDHFLPVFTPGTLAGSPPG